MTTPTKQDEVERRRGRTRHPRSLAEDFALECTSLAVELRPDIDGGWPSGKYREDPVAFFREILGIEPWSRQIEMIEAIRDFPRVAVIAGHKVSKSNTAVGIALWFFCSFEDARVVFTSTTSRQVDTILWRELKKLIAHSGRCVDCRRRFELHPELVHPRPCPHSQVIREEPKELARSGLKASDLREIVGFTAKQSEAVSGVSGKNILYIVDEASGVVDQVFEALEGNRAGGGRVVLFSQGTRTEGEFFDAFHSKSKDTGKKYGYKTLHISSEESPNVVAGRVVVPGLAELGWIEERKEEWGEQHPYYKVRVKGEFVVAEEGRILSLHQISESEKRWADAPTEGRLYLGVDPAGPGGAGDESAFAPRRGKKMFNIVTLLGLSEEAHVVHALGILKEHRRPRDPVPVVVVDREGPIGSRVYGLFRAYADNHPLELAVLGVRSSDRAIRQPQIYDRVRDELFANLAEWIREGGAIPEDIKLAKDLHAPKWSSTITGRLKATDKKELRKLIGRSPDRGDAAALSVWESLALEFDEVTAPAEPADTDISGPPLDPYGGLDVWQRRGR
jgi:phage terminase large subunit